MLRIFILVLVAVGLCHTSALAQLATFEDGSLYALDPVANQSTGNRILEQVLDNNDMEAIDELGPTDVVRKLSEPVGRLTLEFKESWLSPGRKGAYCTASLIADDLILTNYHCIPGKGQLAAAMLTMGYLKPRSRKGVAQYPVALEPVEASADLDYAILRVDGAPGKEWGTISLSATTPDARSTLFVIHHPGGYPKYVTRGRCKTHDPAIDGNDILHLCDTMPGSSGAPVFDNNTRKVVGLHYSAVALKGLNAAKRVASIAPVSKILGPLLVAGIPSVTPEQQARTSPQPRQGDAARSWPMVENSNDPADLEAFRRQYGKDNPFYDRLAEKRLAALAPPVAPPPPTCRGIRTSVAGEGKACLDPADPAKREFQDCKGGFCGPKMVVIPKGRFLMGSSDAEIEKLIKEYPETDAKLFRHESPEHEVTIGQAFAVGATHVTRGAFAAFVAATGHKTDGGCWAYEGTEWKNKSDASWRKPGFDQDDNHPVVCVNWQDAQAYAKWVSKETGTEYRLLTEAEAEYVARGTTSAVRQPRYHFGDNPKELCLYGNGADFSGAAKFNWDKSQVARCEDGFAATAPAGSFRPNGFGVKDVHGNAWTWTQDCYADSYAKVPKDGTKSPETDGCSRVLRGGSWGDNPRSLRSADRGRLRPVDRGDSIGFRLARTLIPTP